SFSLFPNYPNPFNVGTVISYSTSDNGPVKLEVFDILGRSIATLVDEVQSVGLHHVNWNGQVNDGNRAASGIYLYRLKTAHAAETRKMIILR
ncbi:MAG: T9SS type A sorting domain-containing protein, partial [Pseudomonadota bacterium]